VRIKHRQGQAPPSACPCLYQRTESESRRQLSKQRVKKDSLQKPQTRRRREADNGGKRRSRATTLAAGQRERTKALVRRRGGHCAGGARPSLSEAPENPDDDRTDSRRRRAMASKCEPACPLHAGIVGEPCEYNKIATSLRSSQ